MRALLSILFILALPQLMVGQESVTLPSRLAKLPNKLPKYEQYALKLTEKYWSAQYHYDTRYIRAIFDTIDIVCIPTLQVKVRRHAKNFHHLPTLLAAARPVKNDSYHLFFNGNRYVGGTEDTPLVSCPGVYGDSLIHTKRGNYHEQLALRILQLKPKFSFVIMGLETAIWFVFPNDQLMVYDIETDKLVDPQEYLNHFGPDELRFLLSFHAGRLS